MKLKRNAGCLVICCLFSISGVNLAHAANIGFTYGSGSGDFDSASINFGTGLGDTPLYLSGSHYQGSSGGDQSLKNSSLGLDWQINEPLSVHLGFNRIDDDIFIMDGGEVGLGLKLNQYFGSERDTLLNLGYGKMDYTPDTSRDIPQALLDRVPKQSRYSIGLVQGLTDTLSANLSYDNYDYTTDPEVLALAIAKAFVKRGFYPPNAAYTLAAFPEHTVRAGLDWQTSKTLGVSLTLGQTKTATGQHLRDLGVGFTHHGEIFTFGVNLSASSTTDVETATGITVIKGGSSHYVDLNFGVEF